MRKSVLFWVGTLVALGACSKHDPILPGTRNAIFATNAPLVLNQSITDLPATTVAGDADANCPYTQDTSNVIKNGDRKIFSGFPTPNSVRSNMHPVCSGKYVYAGLTTGEVVKVAKKLWSSRCSCKLACYQENEIDEGTAEGIKMLRRGA